jgi:hypothetical protein
MFEKENLTKVFIQTKRENALGKRTIVVPKYVKDHQKNRFVIHTIIAIIIGVSVPYFLINFSKDVYSKISVKYFGGSAIQESDVANADKVKGQGSDDSDNAYEIPSGENVLINPDNKGQYYFLGPNYKVPIVNAAAYVVADVDTGEVIIEKNPNGVMPIASISKLVTSIVAKENMDVHGMVTVNKSSIDTYGGSGGMRLGEEIMVNDLLYLLIMESSNDAAEVIASGFGRDEFIKLMNKKVKDLGMNDTSFFEPSGLSEKNVSSSNDLQILLRYITKEHPDLWDISRVRQYSILRHSWGNGNLLSRKSSFIGGKNGFTYEAHDTTASVFSVKVEGGTRRIAVTLLRSDARERDVDLLLRFVTNWVGYLAEGEEL